jgi:6,7-dimethyl-8-ribityllumazine synthase
MLKPLSSRPESSSEAAHRFVIVASDYNGEFVQPMVEKAIYEITAVEPNSRVEVVSAPGSFEIPFLARVAIERAKPDAVLCLGVIFEGKTGHADLIAASVSDSLCRMAVETITPVIHGVLLLRDEEQARERCLGHEINRGTECARAAIAALRSVQTITTF